VRFVAVRFRFSLFSIVWFDLSVSDLAHEVGGFCRCATLVFTCYEDLFENEIFLHLQIFRHQEVVSQIIL